MTSIIRFGSLSRNVSKTILNCSNARVSSRSLASVVSHQVPSPAVSCIVVNQHKKNVIPSKKISLPLLQISRPTSFFNKTSAEQLWKGVTSVSSAGSKRGRGRGVGKKMAKNLNRGQVIGIGHENIQWPGLNAPVIRGKELVEQLKLPKDEEREAKLIKMRDTMGVFRPLQLDPLERGWSGTRLPGRRIGPPDPINDATFDGFDTIVLEAKSVTHMSGIFGRVKRMSMFVVTGNGNGLAGFALAKSNTVAGAMKQAKNRAGQKLLYIERYNEHTVLHDFFCQFGATKIFVKKKPEGFGLVCHRCIKSICEAVGIKDLYAKVEGSTKNYQNLTKAFFLGLLHQKTHQQIADDKQLHVVEFRKENLDFPRIVASPESSVRTEDEITKDEELNFDLYVMGGKVALERKKYPPGYQSLYGWELHKRKYAKRRGHDEMRRQLSIEYGNIRSFYSEQYPECDPSYYLKKKRAEAES